MSRYYTILDLHRLYEHVEEALAACREAGCVPPAVADAWPNCLGFMRRVPGQPLFREPPRGAGGAKRRDEPTTADLSSFGDGLRLHRQVCLDALFSKALRLKSQIMLETEIRRRLDMATYGTALRIKAGFGKPSVLVGTARGRHAVEHGGMARRAVKRLLQKLDQEELT